MEINFSINDNICLNDSNGSIIIDSINFADNQEAFLYRNYIIVWDGPIDPETFISADGTFISNLKNGIYTFRLISSDSQAESEEYVAEISSISSDLKIVQVKNTEYSCFDDTGSIYIEIEGGVSPYVFLLDTLTTVSENTQIKIPNIPFGDYNLVVYDSNNCFVTYDKIISIKDGSFDLEINSVTPPQILNNYGSLDVSVIGDGPFGFLFTDLHTQESIYIDNFETKYIQNINTETRIYNYIFSDLLTPGNYLLKVESSSGCFSLENINIPNSLPMIVDITLSNNVSSNFPNYSEPIKIFDTLLIPYKFIYNNEKFLKYIKYKKIKDSIEFLINNENFTFTITRNILEKDCIEDGDIEILRLGKDPEDWFFYMHIAPGININNNPEFLSADVKIKIEDSTIDITLGTNEERVIDISKPSLIIGSFILDELGYDEYYNGAEIYLNTSEPLSIDQKSFVVKNIKKSIVSGLYSSGFVTILDFLSYFGVLNVPVNQANQSFCETANEDYQYIIDVKNLLETLNNFNYIDSIFIHNPLDFNYQGSILLNISGNDFYILPDGQQDQNEYKIDYLFFQENSNTVKNIYRGSNIIKNEFAVDSIPEGFYILKIKDKYNNIPKILQFNNSIIDYDDHFTYGKKILQKINKKIIDNFIYGDIVIYLGFDYVSLFSGSPVPTIINTEEIIDEDQQPSIIVDYNTISQTDNPVNSSTIDIQVLSKEIRCIIHGPQNYKMIFSESTSFINLVPGVYTILGNEEDLKKLSRYQNEIRVFLDKNTTKKIFIDFVSYIDRIFVKEKEG